MSESLNIVALIANASMLVQAVMVVLVSLSVLSWVIIFQRSRMLSLQQQKWRQFEKTFWSGIDINQLYHDYQKRSVLVGIESLFVSGLKEFGRLSRSSMKDKIEVIDGVQRAMRIAMAREVEKIEHRLPFLATVGSTSPYIGLLGTVWGIMHAFHGLANMKQATIASVAPGISEALVATAMGLIAAIPAVVFYNRFMVKADRLANQMHTFSEEFSAILSRQLHASPSDSDKATVRG